MVVKKFNYIRFSIFIIIVIAVISIIIYGSITIKKNIDYKKTYEYIIMQKGYSKEEANLLEKKLDKKYIDKLLTFEYSNEYVNFINEKYFIFDNLIKYIEYKKDNSEYDYSKVIAIINTEANIDWFDNEKQTDTSKNELMLVNRLYGLNPEYEVSDIVNIPVKYAYDGKKISNSILNNIIDLISELKDNGYTFVVSDGYRSYKDQEKLYNSYVNSSGRSEADKVVARPGHSEYETGLSFDLVPYNKSYDNPKDSKENKLLRNIAHKYGFILRFNADKEYITGFKEYPWRLRYVGIEAATTIFNENICFEEYYAYYVNGEK